MAKTKTSTKKVAKPVRPSAQVPQSVIDAAFAAIPIVPIAEVVRYERSPLDKALDALQSRLARQ